MRRRPIWIQLSLISSLLLLANSAEAATISGTVTDASTGKPLPFAEIQLREIGLSVHTDADGYYLFNNIPAGHYTIVITHGPYDLYEFGAVDVSQDGKATANTALQPDIAPMDRPVEMPNAGPVTHESGDQSSRNQSIRLQDLPTRGYADWVAIQPGTVRRFYGAPLHVRGGRIEEFTYDVDGFSQQDPFDGRSFTRINANTIADIRFRPGYRGPSSGWTASGVAEVSTIESWEHTGSLEVITDNFHGDRSDYNLYAANVAGPLAGDAGQLTYAMAGELRTFGNRELGSPRDWNYDGTWQGNLRLRPSDDTRALFGTRGTYEDWKYTPRAYTFDAVHAPRGIDENYSLFGSLEHHLSSRTILDASLNWFSSRHRHGDGVHFDDLWAYGRPSGNPRFDETALYWAWDDMFLDPDSLQVGRHIVMHTPVVESTFTVQISDDESVQKSFIIRGDEGAAWDDYFEQKGSYIGGRLDMSRGEDLIGLEFQRHTVRAYNHLFPTRIYQGDDGGYDDIVRYGYGPLGNEIDDGGINGAKHPMFLAGYANKRLIHDDLTIDLGARWDHFEYDAHALADPTNPLDPFDRATYADTAQGLSNQERDALRQGAQELGSDELLEVNAIDRLSPRIIGRFQVNDRFQLHASAGRYVQRPPLRRVYVDFEFLEYKVRTGGYNYLFSNPTLDPATSNTFDLGINSQVPGIGSIDITAFFKRFEHLLGTRTQPATPNSFSIWYDGGGAKARGLELSFHTMRSRGITAQASYTLTDISDDDRSESNTQSNIAWTNAEAPRTFQPFTFEQQHRFIGILDVRSGSESGPMLGNRHPLANAGITVLLEAGSGFPYSPVDVHNAVTLGAMSPSPAGALGSERTPATYRLDLKANKSFSISRADLEIYLWIVNLFDRDNVVDVYEGTGEPDNTGWLETNEGGQFVQEYSQVHDASFLAGEQKYLIRQNDPANFDIPRQIRFGMRMSF